jgi:nucleoside-diphosphate-sugar epimerase
VKYVVLGSRGWIGRAVRNLAVEGGAAVVGIGRHPGPGVDLVAPDTVSISAAIANVRPDVVINCAGAREGGAAAMIEANLDLTRVALEAAGTAGARFVQLGSAAEYGNPGPVERVNEGTVLRPDSDYARTKALATSLVVESAQDACVARVFNVIGADPPEGSFLRELIDKVVEGDGVVRLQDGSLVRDWIGLSDVAAAVLALANERGDAKVVNVCSGVGVSHSELAHAIGHAAGRPIVAESLAQGGVPRVVGDPERMNAVMGHSIARDVASLLASLPCLTEQRGHACR